MTIVEVALVNVSSATVLAGTALVASRLVRRPEVIHALWLVVLLDLLAPPILGVGVLPARVAEPAAAPFAAEALPDAGAPKWSLALAGVWIAGALSVAGLALTRAVRFSRALESAREPQPELADRLASLARQAGLARGPRLRVIDAPVPPLVRFRVGAPEIVFPSKLLDRLETRERDAILAHEIAHIRRRDPWVRLVELVATAAFWWNPIVYLARRRLRRAEEACCDGWVVRLAPYIAVDYARALVKTAEFVSPSSARAPALTSGAGNFRHMEERLTMILEAKPTKRIVAPARVALSALAVLLLLSFPTRGGDTPKGEEKGADPSQSALDALEARARALDLEERALDVEREAIEAEVERLRQTAAERGTDKERRRLEADRMRTAELEREVREATASRKRLEKEARAHDLARLELECARRAVAKDRQKTATAAEDARASLSAEAERLRAALAEIEREIESLDKDKKDAPR